MSEASREIEPLSHQGVSAGLRVINSPVRGLSPIEGGKLSNRRVPIYADALIDAAFVLEATETLKD